MDAPKLKNKGFLEFIYSFFGSVRSEEIILAYEGEINHQVMKTFTSLTDSKMSKETEMSEVQRKVYHVLVECLQNIYKHAFHTNKDPDSDLNHGVLLVTRSKSHYYIITGNTIENTRISGLKTMLDEINSLNRKQLDELFRQQLMEGKLSEKGGAGLGFIDIRRKTGNELDFHFLPIDDPYSFFILTTAITRN